MKQFSLFLAFLIVVPLYAVTVSDIEEIRLRTEGSRSEVSSADSELIEEFWETSLNTMLLSDVSQDIVDSRRQFEEQMGSEPLSFYSSVYIAGGQAEFTDCF